LSFFPSIFTWSKSLLVKTWILINISPQEKPILILAKINKTEMKKLLKSNNGHGKWRGRERYMFEPERRSQK